MQITILKLILWARDSTKPRRELTFLPGVVNIITGQSETGKSALIPIVDYCLGAGKCTIPVGKIRNATEWYGLLLQVGQNQMIVARTDPGEQDGTTEMHFEEGASVAIPERPEKNASTQTVVSRFNQLSGLPSLDFAPGAENPGFHGRPSFRDMAAFNFQPQYVVANPYTLFFKADTVDHREKLKVIFPLVLDVISGSTLARKRQLSDLRKAMQDKVNQRKAADLASRTWLADLQSFYSLARELGLLAASPNPDQYWIVDTYLKQLRLIPKFIASGQLPDSLVGNTERAVDELIQLRSGEEYLAHEIGARRSRLARVRSLTSSIFAYGTELENQSGRLAAISWFGKAVGNNAICPICGTQHDSANVEIGRLLSLAAEVRAVSEQVEATPTTLDKEVADLGEEIRSLEQELSQARVRRRSLEDESAELASRRQTLGQVYSLAGQIEQLTKSIDAGKADGSLAVEIEGLRKQISDIEAALDPKAEKARLEAVMTSLSRSASHYAEILGFERAGDLIALNIEELTVRVTSNSGRRDFLWEIGSGANWLGLHISMLLSLHEQFSVSSTSVVPSFLMIDQPSQVYFPARWPGDPDRKLTTAPIKNDPKSHKESNAGGVEPMSEDIEGVRRIFHALADAVDRTKGALQVIVTDHAGPITWEGIHPVHVVAEWRGDKDFLIPRSWD
jgi:FtsZ-binding cell division protein ZapB